MSGLKRLVLVALAACVVVAPVSAVPAPAVVLRLATIAPTNSEWHKALLDMGAACATETAGRVKIQVFPNNALGDDPAVVRNMRLGQLQMSLLMLSGLALIDDSFNALGIPFFFQNDAETNAVRDGLTPLIEKRIDAKKFHLLAWSSGGWVQVFSKKPLKTLDDIKKTKLWTSDGDTRMVQWYKTNGFNPVALDANSIAPQLKIGMIDATPSPAYPALLTAIYKDAPYMLDVHVAPLLGAVVITKASWDAISPEDQAKVTAAARTFQMRTSASIPQQDASAVLEMQKRGLTIVPMDSRASAAFHAEADKLVASQRGSVVPEDLYDKAKEVRDAFRKSGGK